MAAKQKNPLYVVTEKGNTVEEASSIIDLLVKKLNLGPALDVLNQIFQILLEAVEDYPTFIKVKEFIDMVVGRLQSFTKFA